MDTLSQRLMVARRRAGLTQIQLSVKAGISVNSVTTAERFSFATPRTLEKLAKALGVRVGDLVPPTPASTNEFDA